MKTKKNIPGTQKSASAAILFKIRHVCSECMNNVLSSRQMSTLMTENAPLFNRSFPPFLNFPVTEIFF